MIQTQLTDEDIHIFWPETALEDPLVVNIKENMIIFCQYGDDVYISKETFKKIEKLIK